MEGRDEASSPETVVPRCRGLKGREFNRSAIRQGLVKRNVLLGRLEKMERDPPLRQVLRQQIETDFSVGGN